VSEPAAWALSAVELDGVPLAPIDRHELVDGMFDALTRRVGGWVITANVDIFRVYTADAELRDYFRRADAVVADGVPLLWAARLQGTPLPDRVAGSDLVSLFAERAAREGRSIFLLGGDPGVAEAASKELQQRWDGLRIVGTANPMVSDPPTDTDLDGLRDLLLEAAPDLVYLALGSPKQDRVIAALRPDFPGVWWIGVGASLKFLAGDSMRAPVLLQRIGLEWLHRLLKEPRRLAGRYLLYDLPYIMRLLTRTLSRRVRRFFGGDRAD
jgi:N-acetylglucosaminyldiphosphoundecaprenol N-acetyl-beta-D-mannosaminyltransferase